MQPTCGVNYRRDLAGLECKSSILKLLLHITPSEITQVSPLASTAAVRFGKGELAKSDIVSLDAILVAFDDAQGLVLGARNLGLESMTGCPTLASIPCLVHRKLLILGNELSCYC